MLYNTTLTDMETCYKAFRGDVARSLNLKAKGFGCEPEMTAKVFRRRLRVYELPISYDGRTYAEGKKITWRDGIKAIYWCGAITGTVLFGIFSYFWFSPILGFGIIMAAFLVYSRSNLQLCMTAVSLAVILGALVFSADPTAIWSPYSLISVRKIESNGKQKPVSAPRKDITIM